MVFPFLFIGTSEMMFIAFVIVLVFGADKVPEIARGLGKGIRMVKDAANGIKEEVIRSAEDNFENEGAKSVKDGIKSVKEDIEEITGSIKRNRF